MTRRARNSIALDRTFLEVPESGDGTTPEHQLGASRALGRRETWTGLLEHPYVVVLGEAGTGKSTEFARQADEMFRSGQAAFFVELVSLASEGLMESLDPEGEERLDVWKNTAAPAYFFLDSLDEAKLQQHTLGKALRHLQKALKTEWVRVRLIISCRVSDWMADADRMAVASIIPDGESAKVHVVQLVPLDSSQIESLAAFAGVDDAAALLDAIRDNYAQIFVERPLDVLWLGSYWRRHKRIGSLRELVEDDIREKLKEQSRRGSTLPVTRAAQGARALAGIATLCRWQSFLVPDEGLDVRRSVAAGDPREVLPDWSDDEIQQLLRRPIFDEASYGRVRIHHRVVQEFLTACWLKELYDSGLARSKLEDILVRGKPGEKCIPQHLQPVVAWLCLMDAVLRRTMISEAPALMIGYGDPSGFTSDERGAILRAYAASYVKRNRRFEHFDQASLDRFASPALSVPVTSLLADLSLPEELVVMLLELVEHGRIEACIPAAVELAIGVTRSDHVRTAAIYSVGAVGDAAAKGRLVAALEFGHTLGQEVAGAFVKALYPEPLGINGLLRVLAKTQRKRRNSTTALQFALEHEVPLQGDDGHRLELLGAIVALVWRPGGDGRRVVEHDQCWMLPAIGNLLIGAMNAHAGGDCLPDALLEALELFRWCNRQGMHIWYGLEDVRAVVSSNPLIQRELFWRRVEECRRDTGVRPCRLNQLRYSYELYALGRADASWLSHDAISREDLLERLLAFHALVCLPHAPEEQEVRLANLRRVAATDPALGKRLSRMMNGPIVLRPEQQHWERASRAHELSTKRQHEDDIRFLAGKIQEIRSGAKPDLLWFLLCNAGPEVRLQAPISLDVLRGKYGDDVAEAAADGLRAFWRTYNPQMPHDRELRELTPVGVTLGLTGFRQDLAAGLDMTTLDAENVIRAVCYAACELNHFPDWFGDLTAAHPLLVANSLQPALVADYTHADDGIGVHDVLAKMPGADERVRRVCAPALVELLMIGDPPRLSALIEALSPLLLTPGVDASSLDELAPARCAMHLYAPNWLGVWWCCWSALHSLQAVEFLDRTLSGLPQADAYLIVEQICHRMYETSERIVRFPLAGFTDPDVLARLIVLVYEHIKPEDDIEHEGVHTPGPRDHAKKVRGQLVDLLVSIPGDASVAALRRIADDPRVLSVRDWILYQADQRAAENVGSIVIDVELSLVALYRCHGLGAREHLGPLNVDEPLPVGTEDSTDIALLDNLLKRGFPSERALRRAVQEVGGHVEEELPGVPVAPSELRYQAARILIRHGLVEQVLAGAPADSEWLRERWTTRGAVPRE